MPMSNADFLKPMVQPNSNSIFKDGFTPKPVEPPQPCTKSTTQTVSSPQRVTSLPVVEVKPAFAVANDWANSTNKK
jgi:hypothetical protein